ncbi:hypothetical protein [Solibacillus sp. CAU 1738]|uniref:hypothetical protein n=1 Tax=Solibacillus sp. CAU 1738 TaxID=3140363 RepID=UPI003261B84E
MKQNQFLKHLSINTTYQPFFYETPNNDLLVSNYDWPSPINFETNHKVNVNIHDLQIAKYLLSKIICEAIESENITLSKQEIYTRSKSVFNEIEPFNKVLNYLDMLDYLRITNGGKSGRKKIIVLNPKILQAF